MDDETLLEDGTETSGENTEPTSPEMESITLADVHEMTSNIVHTNLFGSFLICGTLVGIFLWRRIAK